MATLTGPPQYTQIQMNSDLDVLVDLSSPKMDKDRAILNLLKGVDPYIVSFQKRINKYGHLTDQHMFARTATYAQIHNRPRRFAYVARRNGLQGLIGFLCMTAYFALLTLLRSETSNSDALEHITSNQLYDITVDSTAPFELDVEFLDLIAAPDSSSPDRWAEYDEYVEQILTKLNAYEQEVFTKRHLEKPISIRPYKRRGTLRDIVEDSGFTLHQVRKDLQSAEEIVDPTRIVKRLLRKMDATDRYIYTYRTERRIPIPRIAEEFDLHYGYVSRVFERVKKIIKAAEAA